MIFVAFIDG